MFTAGCEKSTQKQISSKTFHLIIEEMKKRLPKFLRNKYLLAFGFFLLWICLFNDIDLFYIINSRQEVNAMKTEVAAMENANANALVSLTELSSNQKSLEKFARETYYMKRDNEDVYVFKERAD